MRSLAVLVTCSLALATFAHAGPVALQDVGNAFRKIQSAKFVMAIKSPGDPEQKFRVYVQIPGRMREELPDGVTRITDLGEGRILELHATQKTADLIEIPKVSKQKQPPNIIEILRGLFRRAEAGEEGLVVKKLGAKTIEGRETIGFQVNSDEDEKGEYLSCTIWGDAKTALPVRVEKRMKILDTTIVMTDFVYNLKLAPDLFSLATPAGYETKNTKVDLDLSLPGEKDLVAALRLYAENTDGTLPQAMDEATINKLMAAFASIARAPEGVDPKQAVRDAVKKMMPIAITMGRARRSFSRSSPTATRISPRTRSNLVRPTTPCSGTSRRAGTTSA